MLGAALSLGLPDGVEDGLSDGAELTLGLPDGFEDGLSDGA
jgi:hypothetical protein